MPAAYSEEIIQKELQDLWSFIWRVKNGGINPASIFGTWFAGGHGVNGAVNNADSPFTPNLSTGIVLFPVDTTAGAVRINTPGPTASLQDGQVIFFKDISGNFAITPLNFFANNGGGETVELAQNEGNFGSPSNLTSQGVFQGYKWQKASNRWIGWIGF